MGVTPLTDVQQKAVDALVTARRIEPVAPDAARARAFLDVAADRISQLPLLTSVGVKYDIAYDATHDIGEALLAAYGYRRGTGLVSRKRWGGSFGLSSTRRRGTGRHGGSTGYAARAIRATMTPRQ